jgi:dTDP-4-amino-4,6-dideoxygalactose transaminase
MPCDLARILAVAERRGLPVIEDAACAIGSEIDLGQGFQRVGKPHGVMACFSMHPRKIVTTGDGGMITTADGEATARLRRLRQHAMSVPDTVRHHANKVMFEGYDEPAFNYRMTDLQASIGRPQLRRLSDIVAERRALADRYRAELSQSWLFRPPDEPAFARSNWQSYPLRLREAAGLSQVEALQLLMDRGIAAKRGIMNAHQEDAYKKTPWGMGPDGLGTSEKLRDSTVLIPLFHGMSRDEQDLVIKACTERP